MAIEKWVAGTIVLRGKMRTLALTWKFNYVIMSEVTGVDLVNRPERA